MHARTALRTAEILGKPLLPVESCPSALELHTHSCVPGSSVPHGQWTEMPNAVAIFMEIQAMVQRSRHP